MAEPNPHAAPGWDRETKLLLIRTYHADAALGFQSSKSTSASSPHSWNVIPIFRALRRSRSPAYHRLGSARARG